MHISLTFSDLFVLRSKKVFFTLMHNSVTKFRKKLETCKQFTFYQENNIRNILVLNHIVLRFFI